VTKPIALIVEDEFLIRAVAVELAREAGFWKPLTPTKQFVSFKAALTFVWCLRTSTCPVPWTAWSWPKPSDTAGRRLRLS
jgi:hypothetical protein